MLYYNKMVFYRSWTLTNRVDLANLLMMECLSFLKCFG